MLRSLVLLFLVGCAAVPVPDRLPDPAPILAVYEYTNGSQKCSAVALDQTTYVTAGHCAGGPGPWFLVQGGVDYVISQPSAAAETDIALGRALESLPGSALVAPGLPAPAEPVILSGFGCPTQLRPGVWIGAGPGLIPDPAVAGVACPGDSGGGLFNARGELVAVISKIGNGPFAGLVYVVPVGEAAGLFGP